MAGEKELQLWRCRAEYCRDNLQKREGACGQRSSLLDDQENPVLPIAALRKDANNQFIIIYGQAALFSAAKLLDNAPQGQRQARHTTDANGAD